jgi:signal transduction histidine kinase
MHRLFWKFFTIIWLTMAASIGGVIGIVSVLQTTPFTQELALRQQSDALDVAERLLRSDGTSVAAAFARVVAAKPQGVSLTLAQTPGAKGCVTKDASRERRVPIGATCHVVTANKPVPGLLALNLPRLVPWGTALFASALAAFWLARYLIRPVVSLREGLSALAQGRFDIRIGDQMEGREDEVTALAHDFDRSASRLQQLQDSQQRLFQDVSHELRSPLSRLQAALGVVRQNPARIDPMIERMGREIERLDDLIGEILTLARLANHSEAMLDVQKLDVMDLLNAIVSDAAFEGQARGIEIAADTPDAFVAEVNGELIYRALENVIRNALKYTADHSLITITGTIIADKLRLTVNDQGPGMPADDIEAMFRPFFRGGNAVEQDGHGLGLAITRQAVERHGGQVSAAAASGGGLAVTIEIPRSRP